jgi:chromosome segregation ATPase
MLKLRTAILVLAMALLAVPAFAGPNKEMIELQAQIQQLLKLQQSIDEKMGVLQDSMKTLLQQTSENLTHVSQAIERVDKSMAQQSASSDSCVDQLTGQAQPLHDALTELKASVAAINKQLADMNSMRPAAPPQQGTAPAPQPGGAVNPR